MQDTSYWKNLYSICTKIPSFSPASDEDPWAGIVTFVNKTEDILECSSLYPGRVLYTRTQNKSTLQIRNVFSFYGRANGDKETRTVLIDIIKSKISDDNLENIFILGDFNFVTSTLDRNSNSYSVSDNMCKAKWEELETSASISDTFRALYKNRRLYTWSNSRHAKSRIDRIYIPSESVGQLEVVNFENSLFSDHKLVRLRMANEVDTGPGTWIFNNSLLNDQDFVSDMRNTINEFSTNATNLPDHKTFWDFLKMTMSSSAKQYSVSKSRMEKRKLNDIKCDLESLETISPDNMTPGIRSTIDNLKKEERNIAIKKIRGSILRARIPHMEENEISISEISRLEKKNGESNQIYSLEDEQGNLQEGTENVKKVAFNFYSNLYHAEPVDLQSQNLLFSKVGKKLTIDQKHNLDRPITKDEILESLIDLKNNKSPGEDGLTKEFYLFFWPELSDFYYKCIEDISISKELSSMQKRGLIRIIYKKDGRTKIKNYRPISLLNVDLKILTRLLAKRLIPVLKDLIHPNQTCLPGRRITKNIHILQDFIDLINEEKDAAAVIFLDQEKAFDRISHHFILGTLKAFGFGNGFIQWVKTVYTNITSSVKINGYTTDSISIERGVRQGCPLSALLYVLCAEVLGISIRKNKDIVGHSIAGKTGKLGQYADDIYVIVKTFKSIDALFETLQVFEKASNARVNADKSEGLWVGRWKSKIERPHNLTWTNVSVKCLGNMVGNDRKKAERMNFELVKEKIKTKLRFWKGKFLSLKGRIKVLNIFNLSKLWYICECCDCPPDLKNELQRLILDFVWLDIHQRSINVLHDSYENGGLQLQDISSKIKSCRVYWLSHLLSCNATDFERLLCDKLIGKVSGFYGMNLLRGATSSNDSKVHHRFYRNSISYWRELKIRYSPGNIDCITDDWVYNNELLKNEECVVFHPPGNYRNPAKFPYYVPKYFSDLPVKSPEWGMQPVFRVMIREMNAAYHRIQFDCNNKDCFYVICKGEEKALHGLCFNDIYSIFISKKSISRPWIEKWESEFDMIKDVWMFVWRNVHDKTLSYDVQSSAWEMIHRNFVSSSYITKYIDQSASTLCKLCHKVEEHRTHVFTSCEVMMKVFQKFLPLLKSIHNSPLELNEIVFGITEAKLNNLQRIRNYVTFAIKHILFRSRNTDFGGVHQAVLAIFKKIQRFVVEDLSIKYHIFKHKNKVDIFVNTFCINSVLVEIQDNTISVNI